MDTLNSSFGTVPPLPLLESLDDIKGRTLVDGDLDFPSLLPPLSCEISPPNGLSGLSGMECFGDSFHSGGSNSSLSSLSSLSSISSNRDSPQPTSLQSGTHGVNGASSIQSSAGASSVDKLINGNSVVGILKTYSNVVAQGGGNTLRNNTSINKGLTVYSSNGVTIGSGSANGLLTTTGRRYGTQSDTENNSHAPNGNNNALPQGLVDHESNHHVDVKPTFRITTTTNTNHLSNSITTTNGTVKRTHGGSLSSDRLSFDSVISNGSEVTNNVSANGTYNGPAVIKMEPSEKYIVKQESFDSSSDLSDLSDEKYVDSNKYIDELLSEFNDGDLSMDPISGYGDLLGGYGGGLYTTTSSVNHNMLASALSGSPQTLIGHLTEQQYPGLTGGSNGIVTSNGSNMVLVTSNGITTMGITTTPAGRVVNASNGTTKGSKRKNSNGENNGNIKRVNSSNGNLTKVVKAQNGQVNQAKITKVVKKMVNGFTQQVTMVNLNGNQIKKANAIATSNGTGITYANGTMVVNSPNGQFVTATLNGQTVTTASNSMNGSAGSGGKVAKCRKQFGQQRRDLWCAQCKWKKACSRVKAPTN